MHPTRRLFIAAGALTASAFAQSKVDPVNHERNGVAIRGYDPVAYFTGNKPIKGDEKFTATWNGATWRFATAAHRDAFAQAPERYAPQYGGYCAYAVSKNYTAEIDPRAWKIVEGKLYLNYSLEVRDLWQKDQADRISAADRNWPSLHR